MTDSDVNRYCDAATMLVMLLPCVVSGGGYHEALDRPAEAPCRAAKMVPDGTGTLDP